MAQATPEWFVRISSRNVAGNRTRLRSEMPSVQEMIERLLKKKSELLQEAARLEKAIDLLRSTAHLFGEDEKVATDIIVENFDIPINSQISNRSSTLVQPEDIARLARKTLLDYGRPAKRGPLVRLMEQAGVPLTGKDKAKNLGTILWRFQKQFVNLEGHGYWPRDTRFNDIYDPKNPPDGIKYVALDAAQSTPR